MRERGEGGSVNKWDVHREIEGGEYPEIAPKNVPVNEVSGSFIKQAKILLDKKNNVYLMGKVVLVTLC